MAANILKDACLAKLICCLAQHPSGTFSAGDVLHINTVPVTFHDYKE